MITAIVRLLLLALALPAAAEEAEAPRPFVKGGAYDKPYLYRLASGRAMVGGYAEAHFRYEEEEGVVEERTFVPKRFNLFVHSVVSDRFRMASELEFEEGTAEILLELAVLDFEVHPALSFRAGMILTPLGKFNLGHDSPANKLTDRPLVSTEVIPTTLSEPGMGVFGALFPTPRSRLTFELYAVNGFHDGLLEQSTGGTRIADGRHNVEDNNNSPAFAGRIGLSPLPAAELGLSWHVGQYNRSRLEDLDVDEARSLRIAAVDGELAWRGAVLMGEYAVAAIDLPPGLAGSIFASGQDGIYLQASVPFLKGALATMPEGAFEGVARFDRVDFDRHLKGDQVTRWTGGLNFRPTPESVFKLDYSRSWTRDRSDVLARGASVLLSVATYF